MTDSDSAVKTGVLGLGRIGLSFALALNRYNQRGDVRQRFDITVYDPRRNAVDMAEQRDIPVRIARSVPDAVQGRDIIVLALPYAEVQEAYRIMSSGLRTDVVVLDASPLILPSLEWAQKYLPATAHVVGITPIINPKYLFDGLDDGEHAAEDMFDQGTMLLTPSVQANRDAVELASGFSQILGSIPHFVDPVEHDGVAAAAEGLPSLLAVAMFAMLRGNSAWGDAQRAGNPSLGQLTHHLHDTHPDDLRDLLLLNRENTARYLGELIDVLETLQKTLLKGDRDALETTIIGAAEAHQSWLAKRMSGRWDNARAEDSPRAGDALMSGLLGGFLARRLRGDKSR